MLQVVVWQKAIAELDEAEEVDVLLDAKRLQIARWEFDDAARGPGRMAHVTSPQFNEMVMNRYADAL